MEITEKLTKQLDETRYLSAENTFRYRPIMRYFYQQYQKIEYWLYKEDVYNELKDIIDPDGYTLEKCESDLAALVEWKSLEHMQDTKNAKGIDEFKNRKFRYQMSQYAVEIERLTIQLEEMEVKTASLEPKLFERIRASIQNWPKGKDQKEIYLWWQDLNHDFTTLNQNYQDYLKEFHEAKTETLLKSETFLAFKSKMINYLREFIKGYQNNVYLIQEAISHISQSDVDALLEQLIEFQKQAPKLRPEFDFDYFREINFGKWNSIQKWFLGDATHQSEGEKLLTATNNIIVKITKYASAIIDVRGNMTSRKEEYKHICKLFDQMKTVAEANQLSSVIFGIPSVRHFLGVSHHTTDTISNVYDEQPIEILLSSRARGVKEKSLIVPVVDKTYQKQQLLTQYREQKEQERKLLQKLISNSELILTGQIHMSSIERRFLLKIISRSNKTGKQKDSEFGMTYTREKIKGERCTILSEDGCFELESSKLTFEVIS